MIISEDSPLLLDDDDYLEHYGVLGMKWGVHRAERKSKKNYKLAKKAAVDDKVSTNLRLNAEYVHSKKDMAPANRARKAADRYRLRAAKNEKRSVTAKKSGNDYKSSRYLEKAAKLKYKASLKDIEGNIISRSAPYGKQAQNFMYWSDYFKAESYKYRLKIAKNKFYIETMYKKAQDFSKEDKELGRQFVERLNKIRK